jgi:hypothetical protein
MITRRQIFNFLGLGFVTSFASRWWKPQLPAQPEPQLPAQPEPQQPAQPARLMVISPESKDHMRLIGAGDRLRFEFLEKHAVVIYRVDLDKTFILNLDTREYVVKPYKSPYINAKVTLTVTKTSAEEKEKPPVVPQFVPIDPKLVEVPPGFKQVQKFQPPLSLP